MSDPLSEKRVADLHRTSKAQASNFRHVDRSVFRLRAETVLALIAAHERLSRENAALREVVARAEAMIFIEGFVTTSDVKSIHADDDADERWFKASDALREALDVWKAGNHE